MAAVVCVLAGQWKCLLDGQWKFVIDKGQMARAVSLCENMSYGELVDVLADVFKVDRTVKTIHLSFWCPEITNFCTQTKLPPVTIASDSELLQFRNKLALNEGLNLFLSFAEEKDDDTRNPLFDPTPNEEVQQMEVQDISLDHTPSVLGQSSPSNSAFLKSASSRKRGRSSVSSIDGRGQPSLPTPDEAVTTISLLEDVDHPMSNGPLVLPGDISVAEDVCSDGDKDVFVSPPPR